MNIKWDEKTKELDISNNNLKSLTQIDFSLYLGVEILYVGYNNLTDLIGCPDSVIRLYAYHNKLTTLNGCPNSVTYLDVSNNQLTTLAGCPNSVTTLHVNYNNLTDLSGCPNSVIRLNVYNNRLTTLNGCPNSVEYLFVNNNQLITLEYFPYSINCMNTSNNPLNDEWQNLTFNQIKEKSLKIKKYKEMITTSRIYGLWLLKNYEVFNIYTSNNINIPFELIKHIILFVK
jgi:Leucine-rich repeat (LRR) protein